MGVVSAMRPKAVIARGDRHAAADHEDGKPYPGGRGKTVSDSVPRYECQGAKISDANNDNRKPVERWLRVSGVGSHVYLLSNNLLLNNRTKNPVARVIVYQSIGPAQGVLNVLLDSDQEFTNL